METPVEETYYSDDEIRHALTVCRQASMSLKRGCVLERLTVGQLILLASWLDTSD